MKAIEKLILIFVIAVIAFGVALVVWPTGADAAKKGNWPVKQDSIVLNNPPATAGGEITFTVVEHHHNQDVYLYVLCERAGLGIIYIEYGEIGDTFTLTGTESGDTCLANTASQGTEYEELHAITYFTVAAPK